MKLPGARAVSITCSSGSIGLRFLGLTTLFSCQKLRLPKTVHACSLPRVLAVQGAHAQRELRVLAFHLGEVMEVLEKQDRLVIPLGLLGGDELVDFGPEIALLAHERFEVPLAFFGLLLLSPGFLQSGLLGLISAREE